MSDSWGPHGLYVAPPGCSVQGILRARTLERVPPPPPGDLPDPGMGPQSPALAGGLFTTELPGKPMAAGEGFIFSSKEQVPATVVFLLSSSSLQQEMTPGSKQPFLP